VASEENGPEVNVGKTKYIVMFGDHTAWRSYSMEIDSSSFKWVEGFKHLGKILTNQNSFKEEIKSTLKPGNACTHLVQNILFSTILKINIHRTIVLMVILYG
jgi:ABC-type polysaccharide transport system permease subunit